MTKRHLILFTTVILLAGIAGIKHLPGVVSRVVGVDDSAVEDAPAAGSRSVSLSDDDEAAFTRVQRPGSVDLRSEYNLDGLTVPEGDIHTLLARDAIPALTDPKTLPAGESDWLDGTDRVIFVEINGQRLGVPLDILDWHEIVNATVGGEPIAVTYCPLCDSATVFSRRVSPEAGEDGPIVLEFGVSGALYNSNVLMYDRQHKGLWSQLGMDAISGPMAGTSLAMLPVRVMRFETIRQRWPKMPIVSTQTGHQRPYGRSAYASYFRDEKLMVPVRDHGDALPAKTLGVGISLDADAWFIPMQAIGEQGYAFKSPKGIIEVARNTAGVEVCQAPGAAKTAQTFYYSWSAFYPHTQVLGADPVGDTKPQ